MVNNIVGKKITNSGIVIKILYFDLETWYCVTFQEDKQTMLQILNNYVVSIKYLKKEYLQKKMYLMFTITL